jgi:hypothetical protein
MVREARSKFGPLPNGDRRDEEGAAPAPPGCPGRCDQWGDLAMDQLNFTPDIGGAHDATCPALSRLTDQDVISDRYLFRAIGVCCTDEDGRLLVKRIAPLIERYAPADRPTVNEILQERRRAFLEELSSTTKRALPPIESNEINPVSTHAPLEVNGQSDPLSPKPALAYRDAKLIANGYEPIAVNGKIPVAKGWNARPNTTEAIAAERVAHRSAVSTGLRTGRLVGVDIDIIPAPHVQAVQDLATRLLGYASLERIGAKGAMLCYRNETPIGKITVVGKHEAHAAKVEILGVGQQFVSYGVHPDTEKPYTWTNSLIGAEPLKTPLDKLPEVTPEKLQNFAEELVPLLSNLGYSDAKVSGRTTEVAEVKRFEAAADVEWDSPTDIERARIWLQELIDRDDVAVEGQGGDSRTYRVVCGLRDLGISPRTAFKMLLEPGGWNEHCAPPWVPKELAVKVHNAYKYGKNAPGALATFFPLEWQQAEPAAAAPPWGVTVGAAITAPASKLVDRFRGRWPDEYEQLPELEFWDDDKTLPHSPDGCIAIVYGEFGSHKTNTVLAMVLDAVLEADARVCYAAGEGAHGVGKQRIPAHCEARGITTKDLRGRFRIVPAVPVFASLEEVAAFIEAQKDLQPNIVVLDTLATVIAGEDENSSKAAAFLTANGPAGRIRDAFNALVILPAHQGKDAGKRVRGHSGFMGNADVVLHVEANKQTGGIKITVEKMRDGRDGFSIFFKVPPSGSTAVPVPEKIAEREYLTLTASPTRRPDSAQLTFDDRRDVLFEHSAVSFDTGLTETRFAELLVGQRPGDDDAQALAQWKTLVEQERKSLQNAHTKSGYKGVLSDQRFPTGGDKMEWRWFIVKPEDWDTGSEPGTAFDATAIFAEVDRFRQRQSPAGLVGSPLQPPR